MNLYQYTLFGIFIHLYFLCVIGTEYLLMVEFHEKGMMLFNLYGITVKCKQD